MAVVVELLLPPPPPPPPPLPPSTTTMMTTTEARLLSGGSRTPSSPAGCWRSSAGGPAESGSRPRLPDGQPADGRHVLHNTGDV